MKIEDAKCESCGSSMHIEKNDCGDKLVCCDKCVWFLDTEESKELLGANL